MCILVWCILVWRILVCVLMLIESQRLLVGSREGCEGCEGKGG